MLKKVPAARLFLVITASILYVQIAVIQQLHAQATSADTVVSTPGDASPLPLDEEAIAQGRSLFRDNCQVCHQVQQQLVGPALANVAERRPIPWLLSFINNSQQVIQSGDEYAVELYNRFNKTVMPSFDFSDEEILSILAYIEQESEAAPEAGATAGAQPETAAQPAAGPSDQYINIILIGILIVLILILVVLALIISTLTRYLAQRAATEGTVLEQRDRMADIKKFMISKPVLGILSFIFIAIIAKTVIDQLYQVGIQEGYAPAQPVWFSHKIHAGTYQIDCNYCHTGAQVGKNANIPAVNVCMNCHNPDKGGIVTGTITGETELAKVVSAFQNNEPIQWIRVHNLPDLAYFNHAQHVNVGGVECQTCHGPVEEMDVVVQSTNLTMGWCIDCHRTTPLNVQGNEYYDKLVEIHDELGQTPLTVADIGGTECSKCHY